MKTQALEPSVLVIHARVTFAVCHTERVINAEERDTACQILWRDGWQWTEATGGLPGAAVPGDSNERGGVMKVIQKRGKANKTRGEHSKNVTLARAAREAVGHTSEQAARKAGVTKDYLLACERNGATHVLTQILAPIYKCPIDYFLPIKRGGGATSRTNPQLEKGPGENSRPLFL